MGDHVYNSALKSHNSSTFITRSGLIMQVKGFHGVETAAMRTTVERTSLDNRAPGVLNRIIAVG